MTPGSTPKAFGAGGPTKTESHQNDGSFYVTTMFYVYILFKGNTNFPYLKSLLIKSVLPLDFKSWIIELLNSFLYQKKNFR